MALVDINNPGPARRRLTSVLALDICGYSALSERDEDLAIKTVHRVTELLEQVAASGHGRIFHKAGDGFLAEFTSASACLNGALDILARVQDDVLLQANKIEVRIGLHVGDVADQDDGDLLGHGVNIAARLQGEAEPNGILASANLMNLVSDTFTGQKRRRGPLSLKNITEPVEAYDIAVKTGPLHRLAKRIWRPVRRNMVATGLAFIVLAGVFLAPSLSGSHAAAIEARVDTIMSSHFEGNIGENPIRTIDSAYMRGVLRQLGRSDLPSHKASFAMIEAGDVTGAVRRMETLLAELSPRDAAYSTTLHQIGALAFQHEPRKAAASYRSLLIVDPLDQTAQVYLGRTLGGLGELAESVAAYKTALANPNLDDDTRLRLRLNLAFAKLVEGHNQDAVDALRAVQAEVEADGAPDLVATFQTELGLALERVDKIDEAEAALIMAANLNKQYGFEYDLERVYNVLGFIAEKRATASPDHATDYLAQAEDYYTRQFEISQKIDKKRGMAAALYYRGDIQRRSGQFDAADATLMQGFRISNEQGLKTYEFLARLGLAESALDQNNLERACEHFREARIIQSAEVEYVGPRTAAKLQRFDCGA